VAEQGAGIRQEKWLTRDAHDREFKTLNQQSSCRTVYMVVCFFMFLMGYVTVLGDGNDILALLIFSVLFDLQVYLF
jgi:membrane protein required for beta-lactamase induction